MMRIQSKLPEVGTTIFTVMSQLAIRHDAINLSQGFPDFDCSPRLVSLVGKHMAAGHNQYAPMAGVIGLREKISEKVADLYGIDYHPDTAITVTAGATQALFTAVATIIHPGDEAIIFEPAYDAYGPAIKTFGGVVKAVTLSAPDFAIDWQAVGKLITSRTKLIIINTPNNPTGRVFSDADYRQLIQLVRDTAILILSDEVYEHIIFDGKKHLSVLQYPELRDRSFVVASFGKLYHTTGWKVGYCLAPDALTGEFRKVHQFNVFSVNTPMQYALADFMEDKYEYLSLDAFFQEKRDFLVSALANTKLKLLPCEGTYFLLADYSGISTLPETGFCRELTVRHGVATIPISAFYRDGKDQQIIRICFAKKESTIQTAVERLIGIDRV